MAFFDLQKKNPDDTLDLLEFNKIKYSKKKGYSNSNTVSMVCSKCGAQMRVTEGKFGKFYSCTKYPDCRNTSGYYNSPEFNSYYTLCIYNKFDKFLSSTFPSLKPGEVKIDFLSDDVTMTEQSASSVVYNETGTIRIYFNQYYNFKSHFDILQTMIHKYAVIDMYFKNHVANMTLSPGSYYTEDDYISKLTDKEKKDMLARVAIRTGEVMNEIFLTVFDDLDKKTKQNDWNSNTSTSSGSVPYTELPF